MEICIGMFDKIYSKRNRREESQDSREFHRCVHPKITPQMVDGAQLVLYRDVVDDELIVHDPVSQPQESAHEVFTSTALPAKARQEQSPLVVTEDAGAVVDDTPERKCILPDVDFAFFGFPELYEATLKPMGSTLLFRL